MPPSRKSSSPAPVARKSGSVAAKSPAAGARQAASGGGRPSKSPARKAPKEEEEEPEEKGTGSAASSSEGAGKKAAATGDAGKAAEAAVQKPAAPKATPPSAAVAGDSTKTVTTVVAAVAVLLALLAGAAFWPYNVTLAVPRLGQKAFDGKTLKTGTYTGNSLVIFTEGKRTTECKPCADLNAVIKSPAFETQHAKWYSSHTLRMGKVPCDADKSAPLCTRFGITGDEPGEATGLPHILWFKGGVLQEEGFDGEKTLEGFRTWAEAKSAKPSA